MRKIINGKKYDTDTAKEICSWQNMWDKCNYNYICFTLYLKKTGEFFFTKEAYQENRIILAGNIGCEGLIDDQEQLIACPEDFVAQNADVDTYEELFGEVSE